MDRWVGIGIVGKFGKDIVHEFLHPVIRYGGVIGGVGFQAQEAGEAGNGEGDDAQVGEALLSGGGGMGEAHVQVAGKHDANDADLMVNLPGGEAGEGFGIEGVEAGGVEAMFEGVEVASLGAAFAGDWVEFGQTFCSPMSPSLRPTPQGDASRPFRNPEMGGSKKLRLPRQAEEKAPVSQ